MRQLFVLLVLALFNSSVQAQEVKLKWIPQPMLVPGALLIQNDTITTFRFPLRLPSGEIATYQVLWSLEKLCGNVETSKQADCHAYWTGLPDDPPLGPDEVVIVRVTDDGVLFHRHNRLSFSFFLMATLNLTSEECEAVWRSLKEQERRNLAAGKETA